MTGHDGLQSPLEATIDLNNGQTMPRLHLGVYETSGSETVNAVTMALEAGYRGFDSAESYHNEAQVGEAINAWIQGQSKLTREDVWVTTKLSSLVSYDDTRKRIRASAKRVGLPGPLDLYLIHAPYGGKAVRLECWRAIEDAIDSGELRCAGVSNYGVKHVSIVFGNPSQD